MASPTRKARALQRLQVAIDAYQGGTERLPDAATLEAWRNLPAALETERLVASPVSSAEEFALPPEFDPGSDSVKPYHKAFSRLSPDITAATDALFRARPSRLSQEEAKQVFDAWIEKASNIYGVSVPHLSWDPGVAFAGGGIYYPDTKSIAMSKVSVTTLIHEFRHHLQHEGAAMIDRDLEEDARAWSLSLYYAVRPNLLKRMVEQGRIFHINPTDFRDN